MSADPDKDTAIADNNTKQVSVDCSVDLAEKDKIPRKSSRTVSFPDDDGLVTQCFEPANPWQDVPSTTRAQLVAEYLEACRRYNTPPIESVLQQIRELPENAIGGSTRASRLILSECTLAGTAPVDALEALLSKVQFRRIELDRADIDDDGAEAIFDMIEYYESATVVCIIGAKQLGIRAWQAASRLIKKSAEVIEVEVRWMSLQAAHAPVLARALRSPACRLRALALPKAELAGEPLLCLVIALKSNTSIRELRLPDNNLTSSDAQQIAALLRFNTTIQLLDLSNNKIQDTGVGYIADAIVEQAAHTPPSAKNSPVSPSHCPAPCEPKGLAFLVLWNNELTRNCAPHLAKALRSGHSLCVLNVGRNAMGCEGVRAVAGGALVSLGLQAARLTAEAGLHLGDMLHTNNKLQRLDLRENRLGANGLQAILNGLKENTTITQIDLDDPPDANTLTEESEAATISRLTREIRTLCRRNEPPSHEPDARVHRKISLTCHSTCLLKSGCAGATSGASSNLGATCTSTRSRLRSPLPSPAPSPAGSPIPHAHSRFSVTRVTPERDSATPSSTPSRFKVVQVAEPPQIQVHPVKRSSRFSVTRNYDAIYNPSPNASPSPSPTPSISPTLALQPTDSTTSVATLAPANTTSSDSSIDKTPASSDESIDKRNITALASSFSGSSDVSIDKLQSRALGERLSSSSDVSIDTIHIPSDQLSVDSRLSSSSDISLDRACVSSDGSVDERYINTIEPSLTSYSDVRVDKTNPSDEIVDKSHSNPTISEMKLVPDQTRSDTNLNRLVQPKLVPNSRFSISPSPVNLDRPKFKEDSPINNIVLKQSKELDLTENRESNVMRPEAVVPEIVHSSSNLIKPVSTIDNLESSNITEKTLDKLKNVLPDTNINKKELNTNESPNPMIKLEDDKKPQIEEESSKTTENPFLINETDKSPMKIDENVKNDNVTNYCCVKNDNVVMETDTPINIDNKAMKDIQVDKNENSQRNIELHTNDIIKNISDLNKSANKTYSDVVKTDPKLKDKIENVSFEKQILDDTIKTETNLTQNSVTASDTDVIDINVKVTVKTESVKNPSESKAKVNTDKDINIDDNSIKREDKAMKKIEAITEDLGNLIKEMKDLSFKNKKIKSDTVDLMNTVPGNFKDVVLKKNKSESSLDSPDLEVSRLMNKKLEGSPFCDSSSSLEISGSSMESLNATENQSKPTIRETKPELDRRKVDFCQESSVESTSETNPVNTNFLNMSMSSNESVSPIIFGRTKKIHDSLSSLEASVSSLDSGKHEKVMVTSADSGIEYSLHNPNENKDDNSSNEGTLTHNSSLRETVKKSDLQETLTSSPKRTSSLLDVPALKSKGLDRMRKISWVAPSPSFHIPKVETEKEKPSHLEKLLSLFQHPASIFSRGSQDDEKKSASNTPPRKDSSLTSSFWSWGSAIEKDKDEDSSEATDTTLSERVQVSFVDESFSKKLDSKTPSTDTDNTLSEFQSFSNQASTDLDTTVTVTTDENLVQTSLDLSLDNKVSDNTDLNKPNDLNKNYELPSGDSNKNPSTAETLEKSETITKLDKEEVKEDVRFDPVRPRTFAAVLKSSGSENSLDKQPSPDSGQLVDKLPSKIIRGIKENISPENTLTSSMTNTKTLTMELTDRQVKTQAVVNAVWEVAMPPLDKNDPKIEDIKAHELAPIATIEETCDETADNTIELDFIDDVKIESKVIEEVEKEKPIEAVIKGLENVDLGKEALSYLIYEGQDFEPEPEQTVATKIEEGSLAQELKEAEIKEMLDLSPELVIDEAVEVPEVLTAKEIVGLKSAPAIPERAKLKKSNSLEDLTLRQTIEEKNPKTKTIAFKVPETSPRDIPERRSRLRTRSGSSPKSLPESLNKPCSFGKMDPMHCKKKKKVSSLGKMARDSLLALNMSEDEIAEFRRSYKLTSVESLRSLESVSEDANSQSGTSLDSRCRACLRRSQESLMSLDSITEDCKCDDDCDKPGRSIR